MAVTMTVNVTTIDGDNNSDLNSSDDTKSIATTKSFWSIFSFLCCVESLRKHQKYAYSILFVDTQTSQDADIYYNQRKAGVSVLHTAKCVTAAAWEIQGVRASWATVLAGFNRVFIRLERQVGTKPFIHEDLSSIRKDLGCISITNW